MVATLGFRLLLSPFVCLVSLMVVLASLALVFLLFPFASSIVDCRGLLGFGEFCFTTLTPSIFGSGCRCPSSLDTCLPFVLVFFCLPWWTGSEEFGSHPCISPILSLLVFSIVAALWVGWDGGFWHNFGSYYLHSICILP